ncbi:uncharacterized protein LOC129755538 [Uranotaenia lowii]|uniref:uncharacterized protein LOC129755538 n=1 Tax=Uranotaenia lowii TaxID=190385 RepID=UPI002478BB3B|nr:uncharacterized protein LOC129755538 [Uranotaenia lowii]XP_055608060.1 uncharacterized protein LOC129755538 [Uranotaenia lowii]
MKKVTESSDESREEFNNEEETCQERLESVERVLKLSETDSHLLTTVDSIECLAGSQQGDNYMSIIKRILVRGKRQAWNSDKKKDFFISLIFKRQIVNLQRRKLFRADEAFANEINTYTQLVPVLRKFSRDRLPFPRCIYAGKDTEGDLIVLEDLRCNGFRMMDRRRGLSYRQCRVVVRELANLHAVSLAMKQVQPVMFHTMKEKVTEIVYSDSAAEFYTHCLESSVSGTLESLSFSNSSGCLDGAIKAIERLSGRLYRIMSATVRHSFEPWNVLSHGDTWINNLMFSENHDQVRLIDLQAMRYTSPVIDILHLLYTSTDSKLREVHTDDLIRCYQESLMDALRAYVPAQKRFVLPVLEATFTYENIRNEYDSRILYGLGIAMWLLPAVTFHPDHIPDLDDITMSDFTTKNNEKIQQMFSADYHSRMRETVLEFYRSGLLDEI